MRAMKPLFETIGNFEGFEFVAFWLGTVHHPDDRVLSRYADGKARFWGVADAIFALLGAFIGLYLRYNYFMRAPWFGYEPYVTMGLIFGSIAILLVMLALIRNRVW